GHPSCQSQHQVVAGSRQERVRWRHRPDAAGGCGERQLHEPLLEVVAKGPQVGLDERDPLDSPRDRCPHGYRYSRFCELSRGWASRLSVTMRQAHISGDKLFVYYPGDTVPVIVDRLTGQVGRAQIFVAVMGASNFTYAEASWTQALADWIG